MKRQTKETIEYTFTREEVIKAMINHNDWPNPGPVPGMVPTKVLGLSDDAEITFVYEYPGKGEKESS